ncbi:MAG: DUF3078 domain-containing protein [bacterium]
MGCYKHRNFFIYFLLMIFICINPFIKKAHSTILYGVISCDQEEEEKEKKDEEKEKKNWAKKLNVFFNINQYSYSNWSKGGVNSLSWSSRLLAQTKYTGEKWEWEFTHLMEFGQIKEGDGQIKNSKDKINFDGAVILQTSSFIRYYLGVSLLTQFARGYNYSVTPPEPQSDFWDPAYLTQSFGLQFQVKDVLDSKIGAGLKQTIIDNFTKYSDDPSTAKIEKFKFKEGIESKTTFDMQVMKNLNIRSTLNMFTSFQHLDEVDINWDALFVSKLNSFITCSFNIQLIYDEDVIDKAQIKEELGIGVMFNLI